MSTIADKLIAAAQNEQRIYKKGYDKGVADAGGTVVTKPEVEGNYNITANGSYSYAPPADSVFSKVNVEVAVSGGTEDLNDVLTAQEEKLAELSAILDKKADDGSYDEGYADGFEDGKAEGGDDGYYDTLWDGLQNKGARTSYAHGFNAAFFPMPSATFKPKYSIYATDCENMFKEMFMNEGCEPIDLVALFEQRGIVFDTSNSTNLNYIFYKAYFKRVGTIDATKVSHLHYSFASSKVETIEKLIVTENVTFNYTFYSTLDLTNITFEGVIGKNGLDLSWTNITHDSLMSMINALKDYSGTGETRTVTLGNKLLAKLSDAEKQIATGKGWTLA